MPKNKCYNKSANSQERTIFFMKKTLTTQENSLKDNTPKQNFIIVYDSVYKNNDLTAEELQLLIKLISIAPTFKPTAEKLAKILKHDKRTILKASKGLQAKGYLKIEKHGNTSQWTINQQPINQLTDYSKETLLNALLNFDIDLKQLKELHKRKIIDDRLFIATATAYAKEIQRIVKTKWLDED